MIIRCVLCKNQHYTGGGGDFWKVYELISTIVVSVYPVSVYPVSGTRLFYHADFMHIYYFLTLFAVKIVLRTFPVKYSLACANWRTILLTISVPCNIFLWYRITQKLKFTAYLNRVCWVRSTIPKFFVRFLWKFLYNHLATDRQFINNVVKSLTFLHEAIYQNLILPDSVFTHISHA